VADQRVEASPHGFHREDTSPVGCGKHLAGVARIEADRLLDEHRLARLDRQERVFPVMGMGGGDVDDVDLGVVDE